MAAKSAGRRGGKLLPGIGIGLGLWFLADDVEARGPIAGTINTAVDAVPGLNLIKAGIESSTGWNFIETYEDAEMPEARWEIIHGLYDLEEPIFVPNPRKDVMPFY